MNYSSNEKKSDGVFNINNKNFFIVVKMFQIIAYFLVIFLRFFIKTKVVGREYLKEHRNNVIFASSHISQIDILLIPSTFGLFSKHFPVRFFTFESVFYKTEIAKKNILKKIFYGGWLFRLCGSCEFNRKLKDLSYKEKLKDHIYLLKDLKQSLIIFPSGSFEYSGKISKVLPGTVVLSYYSGVPIIPVYATLSNKITIKNIFSFKILFKVVYGKPLLYKELFSMDYSSEVLPDIDDLKIKNASELLLNEFGKCYD